MAGDNKNNLAFAHLFLVAAVVVVVLAALAFYLFSSGKIKNSYVPPALTGGIQNDDIPTLSNSDDPEAIQSDLEAIDGALDGLDKELDSLDSEMGSL